MTTKYEIGDKVLVEATVIDVRRESVWLDVHHASVNVLKSGLGDPVKLEKEVFVKVTLDLQGFEGSKDLLDALEDWGELIKTLGYIRRRMIADDSKSVTFWCVFETDEDDDMHARDRAQEIMHELGVSERRLEWEYMMDDEVPDDWRQHQLPAHPKNRTIENTQPVKGAAVNLITDTEYRIAYDTRAFSETSSWEIPLADPEDRDEALRRIGVAEAGEHEHHRGRFNFRIQYRTVTYTEWADE